MLTSSSSPQSLHTWQWSTWEGLPYLQCSLLDSWEHGFFTQQFWTRSPAELTEVLQPTAQVYRVRQVHGNTVLTTHEIGSQNRIPDDSQPPETPSFPQADGLLTQHTQQAVWVCSADCTPALIADTRTGQVAAIHAGWRGTAIKILPEAIARLQAQGSRLADLRIALGPAIAGEVYQVAAEVAVAVGSSIAPGEIAAQPEALLAWLQHLPDPPVLPDHEPGRVRLDVRRVNALQLEQLGINPNQVAIAPHCTYQQPNYFFSYRRDGLKRVQWSGIVSR